jgi:hypothetical protein
MTISIYLNNDRCLRIVHFEGAISSPELEQLVTLYGLKGDWLSYDTVYQLDADTVDVDVNTDRLDQLRRHAVAIYADIDSIVIRRSAWIYRNAEMRRIAKHWVTMRRLAEGSSAKFVLGNKLEDALPLFSEDDIASVRTRVGFAELARIGTAA